MKKFIIKFAIFAIVVVAFDFVAGYVLGILQHNAYEKNPLRFEVRAMYAIEQAKSEIDIIGASDASHSYISNMIADSLGLSTFNYGKDGCFFVYQNCLIHLMLEHHTPKVILWEIGKECLTSAKNDDREWQSIKDFYPYYDKSDYCKNLIDSRGKFQKVYMLSGLYRYNSSLFTIIEPFLSKDKVDDASNGYLPLPNDGYNYPEFKIGVMTEGSLDTRKVAILKGTLAKCRDKGIKVVFSFSPKFSEDNSDATIQYEELKKIAEEYGVIIIDNRSNEVFNKDATLFKDNVHLNDKGANLFMRVFIPELKRLLGDFQDVNIQSN